MMIDPQTKEEDEPGGKVKHIADETRGLVEDVKTWVDLRLQLTQLEVEGRVNDAVARGVVAAVASLAILFALVGIALLLGDWIGKYYIGFLIVAAFLLVVTLAVWLAKPRFVKVDRNDKNKH